MWFPGLRTQRFTQALQTQRKVYASNARSKTRLARKTEGSNLTQAISRDKFQPSHWSVLTYIACIKPCVARVRLETALNCCM